MSVPGAGARAGGLPVPGQPGDHGAGQAAEHSGRGSRDSRQHRGRPLPVLLLLGAAGEAVLGRAARQPPGHLLGEAGGRGAARGGLQPRQRGHSRGVNIVLGHLGAVKLQLKLTIILREIHSARRMPRLADKQTWNSSTGGARLVLPSLFIDGVTLASRPGLKMQYSSVYHSASLCIHPPEVDDGGEGAGVHQRRGEVRLLALGRHQAREQHVIAAG